MTETKMHKELKNAQKTVHWCTIFCAWLWRFMVFDDYAVWL